MGNLSPSYYNKFECLGSECVETCCKGWNIPVDLNSHLKLNDLSRKYDDNIEKFLTKSRNPTHDKFSFINMKKNGSCPFLDKNKLCGIQKKYGEIIYQKHVKIFLGEKLILTQFKLKL